MIRHIVWWTLKPAADGKSASEIARTVQLASAPLREISSVRSVDVSAKIEPSSTVPCQVILVSTHDSMADLEAYKKDPVHMRFAQLITAVAASRSCIDYELE